MKSCTLLLLTRHAYYIYICALMIGAEDKGRTFEKEDVFFTCVLFEGIGF